MPEVRELYNDAVSRFIRAGIEEREAKSNAGLLLGHVFGIDRNFIYAHGDHQIPEGERLSEFYELIRKREERIPLQHLTHKQSFMGMDFYVDRNVLIPRPDTELLVEEAMIEVSDGAKVLDLCCGSGCILLSLMKYKNGIDGYFSDISAPALSVCGRNAGSLGLSDSIHLIESDLFTGISEDLRFDAILSNPPYIRTSDIEKLEPEVREHDPGIALDGHEDGLYFYRRIAHDAKRYLLLSGLLILETGFDQGDAVSDILKKEGYAGIEIKKDYSGNDRVVRARKPVPGCSERI
ncbi:MAG: peptide chain release factor N(5)-glutamine methyltransferase [Lachnospiraceae bacterium]|nr:peptide chain release factor N(5)-glutamine methyltransferase [Lachnospiraceae bacterium]